MSLIDALFWAAVLVGALALVFWYGRSWRAVAKALVDAGQAPAGPAASSAPRDERTLVGTT